MNQLSAEIIASGCVGLITGYYLSRNNFRSKTTAYLSLYLFAFGVGMGGYVLIKNYSKKSKETCNDSDKSISVTSCDDIIMDQDLTDEKNDHVENTDEKNTDEKNTDEGNDHVKNTDGENHHVKNTDEKNDEVKNDHVKNTDENNADEKNDGSEFCDNFDKTYPKGAWNNDDGDLYDN